jgi:hypothetical protein
LDSHFLEFWGNCLLSAAKGQRQLEDVSRWMSQGMSGWGELSAMFRRCYGLEGAGPAGDPQWETAWKSFGESFRAYLHVLGAVPRSEHAAVMRQRDEARRLLEEQEGLIRRLRSELSECRLSQGDVVRGFQQLIQLQGEQFSRLAQTLPAFFAGAPAKKDGPTP